jgi:ligand-binding SRPBCC domain-containing protein
MAVFETVTELACPPGTAFDFLIRPANALLVTPPDFHARVLEAPEVLVVGSRIKLEVRRFGIPQTMTSEVIALEAARMMRDDQVAGPFRHFSHTHRLEVSAAGCVMTDRIEFEPPGGLLGLMLNEATILRELAPVFAYRAKRFRDLLGKPVAAS